MGKGSESESTRYSRRYSKCSSASFFKLDRNIETHIRTCLTKVLFFQLSTHRYLCNVNISLVPIRRHVPINSHASRQWESHNLIKRHTYVYAIGAKLVLSEVPLKVLQNWVLIQLIVTPQILEKVQGQMKEM